MGNMSWTNVKTGLKPPIGDQALVHMAKFGGAGAPCADYFAFWNGEKWIDWNKYPEYECDMEDNPDYWMVTHWMIVEEPSDKKQGRYLCC